ncbi:MAG: 23S rRNA (pseudouridine(1915)-N(3))-methyltransferase RlmH [Clostridia bacterium]|nr:23S rRNA (pseudouridine(1915)-N(3))-methyltransferase RlmH [Clostridia bacterium]
MVGVKIITVGTLKEAYLRDAAAEYEKRLSAFCKLSQTNLKEEKLPDSPSASEINNALSKEAERILAEMPRRAYKIALCVEGRQLSSEELAEKLGDVSATHGEVCIVIGSSHGLDESVKSACDLRLSFSRLTFPHQLMRVILLEAIYRGFNILKGTHYHK